MESVEQLHSQRSPSLRNLGWLLSVPLIAGLLLILIIAATIILYQGRHAGRVFTGVQIWQSDLSGMTEEEVRQTIVERAPDARAGVITLVDPQTGQEWQYTPAELGMSVDIDSTVEAALAVGRQDAPWRLLQEQFNSWYYGQTIAPVIIFNEGEFAGVMNALAATINQPAIEAQLDFDGTNVSYQAGGVGRQLDIADTQARLSSPLIDFRETQLELLVHDLRPTVLDEPKLVTSLEYLLEPMTFYFQEPLDDFDMDRLELSSEQLSSWLRIEMITDEEGSSYNVFIDENGVRAWLREIEAGVFRAPQNARFYFDDNTRELVLVEKHLNGRALDSEATLALFMEQVFSPDRSMPLIMQEIVPTVNSNATAQELGITELISESTTWFYGSSPERKHNIAQSAAQFFGVVVAPGEEFSFNRFLGDVTEDAGFETGLVIIGGRTVEGVGGGVCQVSTTVYQAAFWAGFPITERLEHGYRVPYYDDGEGPGMDATVFTPLVDFKFVNNTEYYLLIENYYNPVDEALTFKFYSTDTGRRVEKSEPIIENVVPPKPDVWEFNPELEEGEIKQVDWAIEGSKVTVLRRVFDSDDNLMYGDEYIVSNYIPWQNVYQYGPGTELPPGANAPSE